MSIDDGGQPKHPQKEIVKMFRESVRPYSQALVALHPHLYISGLYHRASELKALDRIVSQLEPAVQEARNRKYNNLPPLLEAIKDTLNGQPKLSWWNLFTVSVGHALAEANEETKNEEEMAYLIQISNALTEIIRSYNSPNTKLLLEIRLTALEVDSRLVELEKLPQDMKEPDETLDYLCSEFGLLIQELDLIKNALKETWNKDIHNILTYISKAIQLMHILENVSQSHPSTYQRFLQNGQLASLQDRISLMLKDAILVPREADLSLWQMPQLEAFYELFVYFPESIPQVNLIHLCALLKHTETLFVENTDLDKVRPAIFSSRLLKHYVTVKNSEFAKIFDHARAVLKGMKQDPQIGRNIAAYLKDRLMRENDLHHICSMVRYKGKEYQELPDCKEPPQIQKEILFRMNMLVSASQPKDLDAVLKAFTDEEKENRYYLTQEIILEQFIRWRKQGIY